MFCDKDFPSKVKPTTKIYLKNGKCWKICSSVAISCSSVNLLQQQLHKLTISHILNAYELKYEILIAVKSIK